METIGIECRRHIKPGDIFKAHLTATTGASSSETGVPHIDEVTAQSVKLQKRGGVAATYEESASGGMLRGHESVYSGDFRKTPYHWGVGVPRFTLKNIHSPEGHMENIQRDVMDAIQDALSKEALIKKLIIPFSDPSFECKHAASHWEWQKNAALLELEHRNQQLQHKLNEAAKELMEVNARAEYDRNLLAKALQKGKEELYLIGRAEAMRTRLIERTKTIARSQLLNTSLSTWRRYVELCRKKRTLKKAEIFWQRHRLERKFYRFIVGCETIRKKCQLKLQARLLWLQKCFKRWWFTCQWKGELKKKIMKQVKLRTHCVLRTYFKRWQTYCSRSLRKKIQVKRARKLNSYSYLQKSWNQWKRRVKIAREGLVKSRNFLFHRLVGDCVRGWFTVVSRKKRYEQQMEMGIHLSQSKALLVAFEIWCWKIRMVQVVKERLAYFVKRRTERLLQTLFTKWHHHILRNGSLRTIERLLKMRAKVWRLIWGFSQVKQGWVSSKLVEKCRAQRVLATRSTLFQQWRLIVKQRKAARQFLAQVQKGNAQRRLQRSFYLWTVYTADSRRFSAEEEAHKLEIKIKVLEIDIQGAARVQREMDNLVHELESGRKKLINSLDAAIARTPVWTSGFLDVLLRWTVPLLAWLPPGRAGHTAVSLPNRNGSGICTRVVVFGGYNGEEFLNDVFVFEADGMQWKTPVCSAADGCSIPSPRQTHTSCAVGDNKMVVFGGFDGTNDVSDLFILKISEDGLLCEWSQAPSVVGTKPGRISQHTSCLYKDGPAMVVFGGYRSSVGFLNELWFLDLHWMLWSSPEYFGTPPTPRRGHGAAIIGTKMFVFGGFNGTENLSDLHALDLESMTWEIVETQGEIPSPRRQFSVAVVGQHFVLHGGFSGHKYLGDVFSFHANHKRWNKWPEKETQQSLQEIGQGGEAYGRSMHTMVECGQRLVIFGESTNGVHYKTSYLSRMHQSSLVQELEKAKEMQLKVTECEDAVKRKSMELIKAQEDIEDLQTTLQVESEKRKKAEQGHHVLSQKLQKARKIRIVCLRNITDYERTPNICGSRPDN